MKKLHLSEESQRRVHKGKFFKKFFSSFTIIAAILIILFVWHILSSTSSVLQINFLPLSNKPQPERVNFLLLGNAGGKHDGAQLTDSIIVASYHLKTNKVILISIPRDLWLDNIKHKVNAAYETGELTKNGGNGLKFAEDKIDDILGIKIDYGVRLDFSGFAKAIDLVGGVDIDVPKSFDDYKYPITGKENDLCGYEEKEVEITEEQIKALHLPSPLPTHLKNFGPEPVLPGKKKLLLAPDGKIATDAASFDCRYEHIHYEKGKVHMDGETALKFVRSRMGTNGEGSDFARSKRQQLVIQAFREKALSLETLINPGKIVGLLNTFGASVETDVSADKYLEYYNLAKKAGKTESIVLGNLEDGNSILVNPPLSDYGGAWVLIPPNNDFTTIKDYIKLKLEQQATPEASAK